MNNMNQNNGMQKRMLIMTLIVFVFFLAYEFLVLKPQKEAREAEQAQQAQQVQTNKSTPVEGMVQTDVSGNPIDMSKSVASLSSKAIGSQEIISVITTGKNIIEIDNKGRIAQITLTE